jgi:hypothetical protein
MGAHKLMALMTFLFSGVPSLLLAQCEPPSYPTEIINGFTYYYDASGEGTYLAGIEPAPTAILLWPPARSADCLSVK